MNSVGTRDVDSTSSLFDVTNLTIVGMCPFVSFSLFCIIPLVGSSSLRMTSFQRAYDATMTKFAFSASSRETSRQPLHSPRSTSSQSAMSWAIPIDGSALTTIATGPWVHSFPAILYAGLALRASLYAAHHCAEGKRSFAVGGVNAELMLLGRYPRTPRPQKTLPAQPERKTGGAAFLELIAQRERQPGGSVAA